MSGESFADSDDIFEEKLFGTPVKYSGISASGTSTSPASQSQQPQPSQLQPHPFQATPKSPQPSTSSAPESLYWCHLCPKKLKTARGIRAHLERHGSQLRHEEDSEPFLLPITAPATQKEVFICPDCNVSLKSKAGFLKHKAAHKVKDANRRKPNAEQFKQEAFSTVIDTIVQEMLAEPNNGNENKIKFLNEFLTRKGSENWNSCVLEIVEFISSLVCEKQTKIFPANQYEEALKSLNSYLNKNITMFKQKLISICEEPISPALAGRLVFGISSKLLEKVQLWALQKIRSNSSIGVPGSAAVKPMSEEEKQPFLKSVGSLLRGFYKKHLSPSHYQIQDALRETFVVGPVPISKRQFLNKENWFSGEEESIVPSDYASNFFMRVELCIIQALGIKTTPQVLEKVLEDCEVLSYWHHLTSAYLSENLSLLVMRNIVSSYLKISCNLEERKSNAAEEKSVQASKVALRTHLQHNIIEKDD